jgi:hypothetical protein
MKHRTYYRERKPGDSFPPDQEMRKTITLLWAFSITLWKQRNTELHGTDSALTLRTDDAKKL